MMLRRTLVTGFAALAVAGLVAGCSSEPVPLTAAGVTAIFKEKGATNAECKPYKDGAQLCRLTMKDGTTPTVIVAGDAEKWTTKGCLASEGCKGWDQE